MYEESTQWWWRQRAALQYVSFPSSCPLMEADVVQRRGLLVFRRGKVRWGEDIRYQRQIINHNTHTRTQKSWTVGAWSTNVENFRPQSESENLAPPSLCNTIKKNNKTFQAEEKADRRSTVDFVVNVYQLSSISRLAAAYKDHNMWHLTLAQVR